MTSEGATRVRSANSLGEPGGPIDEYSLKVGVRTIEVRGVSLVFSDTPEIIEARRRQLSNTLTELIDRDKNYACVIMWSIANEPLTKPFHTLDDAPSTSVEKGRAFFAGLFDQARRLDTTRPVVLVSLQGGPAEWVGLGDVICTNSYSGWYAVSGRLDEAEAALDKEVRDLRARHGDKPIFYTEFGADAAPGLHAQPAEMWTEEYQSEIVAMYLRVLARYPYVIGAHPWAFADFKTSQSIMRVGGLNFKGAFRRDRRPKLVAHTLREAWTGRKTRLPTTPR